MDGWNFSFSVLLAVPRSEGAIETGEIWNQHIKAELVFGDEKSRTGDIPLPEIDRSFHKGEETIYL
jgi:hypothetical protein